MARPLKDVDVKQVEQMAAIGCTYAEIAAVVGCSERTLHERFSQIVKEGHLRRNASLRRLQYVRATKGSDAMLIWLGKQYLGQRDKSTIDLNSLTPEQALAILAEDAGTDSGNPPE